MREHLLVDGYNLFHAARGSLHARLFPDIKRLAYFLEHYAAYTGSTVTLVLDGTRFSDEFVDTPVLKVLFSEAGTPADGVMESWMARLDARERLSWVLVSNDVHLGQMGAGTGLRVRSCASMIEDLARFVAAQSANRDAKTASQRRPAGPFNNPFGRLAVVTVMAGAWVFAGTAGWAWEFSGFSRPDSAAVDSVTGEIYVSNVESGIEQTDTGEHDPVNEGGGFISKISGNGLVLIQKFIPTRPAGADRNLREPKGLAVHKGHLFVADADRVLVFRTDTGAQVRAITVPSEGSVRLGPMTLGRKGEIFVADSEGFNVFKIDTQRDFEVKIFAHDEEMDGICGLAFDTGTHRLFAVTRDSGRLMRIDTRGKIEAVRKGLGELSGITVDSTGNLFLSSAERGEVYRIPNHGQGVLTLVSGGYKGASGIGYDPSTGSALIPLKDDGRLVSLPLGDKRDSVAPKNGRI